MSPANSSWNTRLNWAFPSLSQTAPSDLKKYSFYEFCCWKLFSSPYAGKEKHPLKKWVQLSLWLSLELSTFNQWSQIAVKQFNERWNQMMATYFQGCCFSHKLKKETLKSWHKKIMSNYCKKRVAKSVKHSRQLNSNWFRNESWKCFDPCLHNQVPVQALRVHVQHTTSGNGGRRSWLHILGLKD